MPEPLGKALLRPSGHHSFQLSRAATDDDGRETSQALLSLGHQIRQDSKANVILSETLSVLPETEPFEPFRNFLHRGPRVIRSAGRGGQEATTLALSSVSDGPVLNGCSMIHKFEHIEKNSNSRNNIYIFIDEAHRSVAGELGTYLWLRCRTRRPLFGASRPEQVEEAIRWLNFPLLS